MKKTALLLTALTLSACGNSAKIDPPAYVPPQEQGESQLTFQQRCIFSSDPALAGSLINNKSYCIRPLKAPLAKTNFTQDGFRGVYDFGRVQAGAVVRGSTQEGPADTPEFFVDGVRVTKGDVPITYLDRPGALSLVVYGGFYKTIDYSASFCFQRGTAQSPCPNPITP